MGTYTTPTAQLETSTIISTFGSQKPQYSNELYAIFGKQFYSPSLMIESLGYSTPVAQDTFYHFEEVRKQQTITNLTLITAQGVGNPVSITVAPASVSATNNIYARQWFKVQFKNGKVGSITNIDFTTPAAPILTVVPSGNYDLGAIAAGEKFIITGSAFSQGSEQPKGIVTGTTQRSFDCQIFKEAFQVTGTQMVSEQWFDEVPDIAGGTSKKLYYVYEQGNTEYRLRMGMDADFLTGYRTDNTINPIVDPVTNEPILSTEGLFPTISRIGNTLPVSPTQFSVSTFDTIDAILDKNGAGTNIASMLGRPLYVNIQNAMIDFFPNVNIESLRNKAASDVFGGDKELAASVNFEYLSKNNRTYMFSVQGVFTNPVQLGAPGFPWPNTGAFMPIGRMKGKTSKDMIPTFGTRYRELGGYSRKMETWNVSGAGNMTKVITADLAQFELRTHQGLETIGVNQFVQVTPNTVL